MTKNEIIKEFFKYTVVPIAIAIGLFFLFKSMCTSKGVTDYFWVCILCGIPFGIRRMFMWLVPSGGNLGFTCGIIALNFILGGIIGFFILMWRLAVALWYIPLTIYRISQAENS